MGMLDWAETMPGVWQRVFLDDKDPFTTLDMNPKPGHDPKCSTCGKEKWRTCFYGVLQTGRSVLQRCADQLAAGQLPDWERDALQWQRSALCFDPHDYVEGVTACYLYAYDMKKPPVPDCKGHPKNRKKGECGKEGMCHACNRGKTEAKQMYSKESTQA
eukprot:gene3284-14568_t